MRHLCLNYFKAVVLLVSEKMTKMVKYALSPNVKESEKKILDPDPDQHLITNVCRPAHEEATHQI